MSLPDPAGSPPAPAERLRVELAGSGLLPPLPAAFLHGEARDLLAPLAFLPPGEMPGQPTGRSAPAPDRRALAAALATANRAYGHPRADELADRLADPATRVVVAGQQPGLFGGPLYTLSKLLAVSRWAAALEAAGEPAVAVFWVATEDHDFQEVARATFAADGPLEVSLGEDPQPLAPVGTRTLGGAVERALDEVRQAMPGERFAAWLDRLAGWYRPDARFGEAFCRLMAALAGERCPLLLDAMLPAVKQAEQPWLARLVERRAAVETALAAADQRIEERGYPLQVSPQRGVSPLFVHSRGERRRVAWVGEEDFELRGRDDGPRPVTELVATIAENPVAVSPGVLARPVVQDAILGTHLMLLGPGELSYLPQVAPLYEVLGVAAPWVALRPQVLVLESHQVAKLAEVGLGLAELLAPPEQLERTLAAGGGDFTSGPRERITAALAELAAPALALDPNLERPLEKTREQIDRALDTFAAKARGAAARSDQVRAGRVEKLRAAVLPGDRLQERVITSAHYPGKHGEELVTAIWQQMELDGSVLQVVTP